MLVPVGARAVALPALLFVPRVAFGSFVSTEPDLRRAIEGAVPGETITLADGTYVLEAPLVPVTAGTPTNAITVRAAHPGGAVVVTNGSEEAFLIGVPRWRFEDLHVRVTGSGSFHAYKLEGNGQHIEIRGGKMELFPGAESGVKGAGGSTAPQPDFALIEGTEIWFTSPTTYFLAEGIDAVAVAGWVIRGNIIHDIRTSQGGVAYGAFTKGNSRDTIIENNLFFDCFIAISLGGGGTGSDWVRDGDPTYEDRNGLVRNNIAIRSDDVAVYLYSATGARVYNNTFYDSFTTCGTGCSSIDVRLATSSADIRNNILDKRVNDREGGTHTGGSNLILSSPTDGSWFVDAAQENFRLLPGTPPVDQGETLSLVSTDFEGHPRPSGAAYDIGASELLSAIPAPDAGLTIDAGRDADSGALADAAGVDASPGDGEALDGEEARDGGAPDSGVVSSSSDVGAATADAAPGLRIDAGDLRIDQGSRSSDAAVEPRAPPAKGAGDRVFRGVSGGCVCVTPRSRLRAPSNAAPTGAVPAGRWVVAFLVGLALRRRRTRAGPSSVGQGATTERAALGGSTPRRSVVACTTNGNGGCTMYARGTKRISRKSRNHRARSPRRLRACGLRHR